MLQASDISDDAPLRLVDAARLAFPDGSMSAAGLRRLAAMKKIIRELFPGSERVAVVSAAQHRLPNRRGSLTFTLQAGGRLAAEDQEIA
jgi:hypothetical protein